MSSSSKKSAGKSTKIPTATKTNVSATATKSPVVKKSGSSLKTDKISRGIELKSDLNSSSKSISAPAARVVARAVFKEKDKTKVKASASTHAGISLPIPVMPDEGVSSLGDPGFLDSSEVFDETDHAQHQQLREMASIQERARTMARPESHPDFDGETCIDCGDDLPSARLKLGRIRCVDCQQAIEVRGKSMRGISASQPRLPDDWEM